jgi:hypothetical protein
LVPNCKKPVPAIAENCLTGTKPTPHDGGGRPPAASLSLRSSSHWVLQAPAQSSPADFSGGRTHDSATSGSQSMSSSSSYLHQGGYIIMESVLYAQYIGATCPHRFILIVDTGLQ